MTATPQMLETLKRHWGYDSFRPLQAEAARCVLEHRDSVVVLPTGGGKSLCFQLPALIMDGLAVVVSPLISLMKDQVDALRANGIDAVCVHSGMNAAERREAGAALNRNTAKLLYIAPERAVTDRFLDFLRKTPPAFVAIDEAHCISQWGHDFRPEYRGLYIFREMFPEIGVHAYTATATPRVRDDIAEQLRLKKHEVHIGIFDRPNLVYTVTPRGDLLPQLREILARHPGESGIIYCIRRAETEGLAEQLTAEGLRARPYHAGLNDRQRRENQEAFVKDEIDIIIATVAFGMGIDKPDVRFVVHAGMPKSIEHYQQESGRAGRDGLTSECVLFHSGQDYRVWKYMLEKGAEEEIEDPVLLPGEDLAAARDRIMINRRIAVKAGLAKLSDMFRFCTQPQCRHRALSEYFGQRYAARDCAACDICLGVGENDEDTAEVARAIIEAVRGVEENFGAAYITSLLTASSAEPRIRERGHHKLAAYGAFKNEDPRMVRDWVEQMCLQEYLLKTGSYNTLSMSNAAWEFISGNGPAPRLAIAARKKSLAKPAAKPKPANEWDGVDRGLFDALRSLRREIAGEAGLAPYMVFGDTALRDMARVRPSGAGTLLAVRGVGERKARDFGEAFLACIEEYCGERNLDRDVGLDRAAVKKPAAKETGKPSIRRIARIRQLRPFFERRMPLDEIARHAQIARTTVGMYLAEYIEENRITRPEPWLTDAQLESVAQALDATGGDRLKPIFDQLGGDIPYEEIRAALIVIENRANEDPETASKAASAPERTVNDGPKDGGSEWEPEYLPEYPGEEIEYWE